MEMALWRDLSGSHECHGCFGDGALLTRDGKRTLAAAAPSNPHSGATRPPVTHCHITTNIRCDDRLKYPRPNFSTGDTPSAQRSRNRIADFHQDIEKDIPMSLYYRFVFFAAFVMLEALSEQEAV